MQSDSDLGCVHKQSSLMLHMHACSAVEMENGPGRCHPVSRLGPLCAPFVALLTRPSLISRPPLLAASLLPSCSGPLACLLSVQGLAGVRESWLSPGQRRRGTRVPTRNVSENDLSLVSCNLNRKKASAHRQYSETQVEGPKGNRRPDTKRAMTSAGLAWPALEGPPSSLLAPGGAHVRPRDRVGPVAAQAGKRESLDESASTREPRRLRVGPGLPRAWDPGRALQHTLAAPGLAPCDV